MTDYEVGFDHVICQAQGSYLLAKNMEAAPVWTISLFRLT
ncbi:MAG: hypothetical protein PEGG_01844 [Paraeggerthella hongkongensis]